MEEAKEDFEGDEGVGTGLMLRSDTRNVQLFGDAVQPAVKVERMHERFDV